MKKCAVMSLGHNNPKTDYSIGDVLLENVCHFRDLGIMVSNSLKQKLHCRTISAKAMRVVGMIFRAFSTRNVDTLMRAYITYVWPILESCTVVWSPHLLQDINCIERVQKYFSRRLFIRSGQKMMSYVERCNVLNLQSLELRRKRFDLIMCFKILSGYVRVDSSQFFEPALYQVTRGNGRKLQVNRTRVNSRKHFFSNRVIRMWNSLPGNVVNCRNVEQFSNCLKYEMLKNYCVVYKF